MIDFGISRKTKEGRTKDTTFLGTAGYAAPEQFGFMQTDIRSDIYSIGVVFHEMLTGKMPEGNKCICYICYILYIFLYFIVIYNITKLKF